MCIRDRLCALRNQVAPYENEKGAADRMVDLWVERLGRVLLAGKGFTAREMKHTFPLIAKDFAAIPVTRVPKVKVGVVGEINVKMCIRDRHHPFAEVGGGGLAGQVSRQQAGQVHACLLYTSRCV